MLEMLMAYVYVTVKDKERLVKTNYAPRHNKRPKSHRRKPKSKK